MQKGERDSSHKDKATQRLHSSVSRNHKHKPIWESRPDVFFMGSAATLLTFFAILITATNMSDPSYIKDPPFVDLGPVPVEDKSPERGDNDDISDNEPWVASFQYSNPELTEFNHSAFNRLKYGNHLEDEKIVYGGSSLISSDPDDTLINVYAYYEDNLDGNPLEPLGTAKSGDLFLTPVLVKGSRVLGQIDDYVTHDGKLVNDPVVWVNTVDTSLRQEISQPIP